MDILVRRLKKNTNRPLLYKRNVGETAKKIYFDRKKIYSEADHRIKCGLLTSSEIVIKILNLYEKSRN